MSGQPTEEKLHADFKNLLSGMNLIAEGNLPLRFTLPNALMKAYQSNNLSSWHEIYSLEPRDLFLRILDDFCNLLGVSEEDRLKGIPIEQQGRVAEFARLHTEISNRETYLELFSEKLLPLVLMGRCIIAMIVCQLQNKQSMSSIIDSAQKGDSDAIMKLIKLDPTFFETDFVKNRIRTSALSKDDEFFKDLSKALTPDPKFWSLRGQQNYIVLFLLQNMGDYAYRTDREWADFLAAHDIENYSDPENVRRARGRYGLPRLKR